VKSDYGILEYKICEFLHCTPDELGDKRQKNPVGISFLEHSMIHEYSEKAKAYEKANKRKR